MKRRSERPVPQVVSCEIAVRIDGVVVELAEVEAGDELSALDENGADVEMEAELEPEVGDEIGSLEEKVDEVKTEAELEAEVATSGASVPSNAVANTSAPLSPALVPMVVARPVAS